MLELFSSLFIVTPLPITIFSYLFKKRNKKADKYELDLNESLNKMEWKKLNNYRGTFFFREKQFVILYSPKLQKFFLESDAKYLFSWDDFEVKNAEEIYSAGRHYSKKYLMSPDFRLDRC